MTVAKKTKTLLGTEERLRAALQLKTTENPFANPSISELCRLAGVSRATLYQHHKSLLAELRPHSATGSKEKSLVQNTQRRPSGADTQLKALLYLCLELQLELNSLKALVPSPSIPRKSR